MDLVCFNYSSVDFSEEYLLHTLGFEGPEYVPDCWVVNACEAPEKHIEWHADDDGLFDAVDKQTTIVAISLGPDGLFAFRPTLGQDFATTVCCLSSKKAAARIAEWGLRWPLALKHGTLSLMGGWFQRDFQHSTIPPSTWETSWAAGSDEAQKLCWVAPTKVEPRINLTGLWVRKHDWNCPAPTHRLPLIHIPSTVSRSASPSRERLQSDYASGSNDAPRGAASSMATGSLTV